MVMTGTCHGNGPDHCCYIDGEVCPFLEENTVKGRRWACAFYRVLGNWDRVYAHPLYQERIKPWLDRVGISNCGDFGPAEKQCCYGYWVDPANPTVIIPLDQIKRPPPGKRTVPPRP